MSLFRASLGQRWLPSLLSARGCWRPSLLSAPVIRASEASEACRLPRCFQSTQASPFAQTKRWAEGIRVPGPLAGGGIKNKFTVTSGESGGVGAAEGINLEIGSDLNTLFAVSSLNHIQLYCDPMDCSPPGSSVHGILLASILEWVAMLSSMDFPDRKSVV